ncbi:hypothetical protein MTO96_046805, partial [Rhipicephalus appendiculatus]
RGDKELDETRVVCSRHFDDRYVQRTSKPVINGEVVEIDRERPALTDDAVPTIFPDAPSYLTKDLPRKRKERSIADCETPSAKRMTPSKNDVASQDFGDEGVGDDAAPAPLHPFQQPQSFLKKPDFLLTSGQVTARPGIDRSGTSLASKLLPRKLSAKFSIPLIQQEVFTLCQIFLI